MSKPGSNINPTDLQAICTAVMSEMLKTLPSLIQNMNPGPMVEKEIYPLYKVRDLFIEHLEQRGKTKAVRDAKTAFSHLIKFYGEKYSVDSIRGKRFEDFVTYLMANVPSGYVSYFKQLKAIFSYLVRWGIIKVNPFFNYRLPEKQEKEIFVFTANELEKIEVSINEKILEAEKKKILNEIESWKELYSFFVFAKETGCRYGEITNIEFRHLNFTENIIQVGGIGFQTKTRKIRYVPMTDECRALLLSRYPEKIINPNQKVFSKVTGFKYESNYISRKFKNICRELKIDERAHFHSLRATFASNLVRAGVNILHVRDLLGHSDIATTQKHYAKLNIDSLKSAISVLNRTKAI